MNGPFLRIGACVSLACVEVLNARWADEVLACSVFYIAGARGDMVSIHVIGGGRFWAAAP